MTISEQYAANCKKQEENSKKTFAELITEQALMQGYELSEGRLVKPTSSGRVVIEVVGKTSTKKHEMMVNGEWVPFKKNTEV